MTCCRRDRKGACQSCVCAREGKFCTDCLPKYLGSCQNIVTEPQAYTVENQPDQVYTYPSESETGENMYNDTP